MSNVRITATGDEDLSVEVLLGNANRAWHDLEAGDSVDLAVGGNQTLSVGPARKAPSTFITPDDEPAVETPWVTGREGDLPVGVDVLSEAEVDVIATVPGEAEAEAEVVNTLEADSPLKVGSISDLPSAFDSEE